MKITSFSPLIMSKESEKIGKLFEELGFHKTHEKKDVTEAHESGFRMKDEEGHSVSIAQVDKVPRDMTLIQMNVDNFDEAYELFKAHGFVNMKGSDEVIYTGSAKTAVLVSPSGFAVNIIYHIKDKD